jgi:hypothetical protein
VAAELDTETRARIEQALADWDNPESEARQRFEAAKAYWDRILQPLQDAIIRCGGY